MTQPGISLIAGLGNPGNQYAETRHNVGFWFLERLQTEFHFQMTSEKKFKAAVGSFSFNGNQVRVVAPQTFMNLSGQSVAPLAAFYRITPSEILVIHDELDLEPGAVRLKSGGGHGGHNGLRDIIPKVGGADFLRLRIGIGHPGSARDVSGYVLGRPTRQDQTLIEDGMERAIHLMPGILSGEYQKVMNDLHTPAK
ncbi:MAG: aminoacyl-tRNA hydrolase [Gammaproteobacteria bacterium]|nr:aminoacyl-tRNA hydrolase [Gammaproteobacteria bacterium]